MESRIKELKNRLELLRRETSEVEFLIKGYEDTIKLQEESKNGQAEPEKKEKKKAEPVA
jgi:hypothetical protein